jgi:fructose-bisphosphate aldolase, class II
VLTEPSTLVLEARARGCGVAAFDANILEHAEVIIEGAEAAECAVILAISHNAVRYHGAVEPLAAACLALARAAEVPVGLHLDQVEDLALADAAADPGFGSVMFDASTLPYADNVEATRRAAALVHARGRWLEAELGEIGGKDGAHAPHVRTHPREAAMVVEETAVDALAVAVGSSHAMTSSTAEPDLDLVRRLRDAVPVPLVLHGSSGVPDAGLCAAVAASPVKINVGTQPNSAFTDVVRAGLSQASGPDCWPYLVSARNAMAEVVHRLIAVVSGPEEP